jgi:hypothetical protein
MRPRHDRAVCPFFHDNEPNCAERFTLERMSEVFAFCLGEHRCCTVYHELCIRIERNARPILAQAG